MWGLEQGLRLWVCQSPVSMRYGIRGLTRMVWSWKGHSPASGDVYVFFSRDRKTMKALKWDGDGFLMYTKRLSQGCFREVLKGDDEALTSVGSLTLANEKLTATVDELRRQIASLGDAIKGKGVELSKEKAARQAVRHLQGSPSERQTKPAAAALDPLEQIPERKRTNNGAKRKTHPECEVETIVVEPDSPDFDPKLATFMGECDVVRYTMIPTRFIKTIYKVKKYVQGDKVFKGTAPAAPLLNSQYTASSTTLSTGTESAKTNTPIEKYRDLLPDRWKQTQR